MPIATLAIITLRFSAVISHYAIIFYFLSRPLLYYAVQITLSEDFIIDSHIQPLLILIIGYCLASLASRQLH